MDPNSPRWKEITRSEFPWEREALEFVRERLPDHEPYRAWSNFEFIADDGSINEVDLLILTPKGIFLVEIKSPPGIVEGDAGTWSWHHEGKISTYDNPLILANRKAKKLKSLLIRQKAMKKMRRPFIEAAVFLSHEQAQFQLPDYLRAAVHLRDREAEDDRPERPGIVSALTNWTADNAPRHRLDRPMAKAVSRAMDEAGVRPSQGAKKVGDYRLDELLFEGPNYQDWSATHVALAKDYCRVRIYLVETGASTDARATTANAAKREYQILSGLSHDGILKARNYTESERGPALFFEHNPNSQRLDHFLTEHGANLSVDQRLDLIREIAEIIRFAHEKHLVHRALSPQSILVLDPEAKSTHIQILNWQTSARTPSESRITSIGISGTSHVGELVENESTVYMAPEVLTERTDAGEQQDVFSLGALAYRIFSGEPPAADLFELTEKLREGQGLRISSALDGVPESLQVLIQFSTAPAVIDRLDSAAEFLEELERVEDELTAPEPDEELVSDPTLAKSGDRLGHGFVVKRRLGKGASAVALLVERQGKEQVFKIALEPSHNDRLRSEAAVLDQLRHQGIVQLQEVVEFKDRVGLLMEKAGDDTLAQRLRQEGRLHLELLERFGEDLLQIIDWLEQEGVSHRDIKPENLGVAPVGRGDKLHLVLFDFSLAQIPAENIRAGTVPYLDPFLSLRRPPRWDTHAERFAAAMTLYQMATGQLPKWGDGQSDPAVLDAEVSLDSEAFEPSLRDTMAEFFAKALRRNYQERFDNAQEMLTGWRGVFSTAGQPAVSTDHEAEDTDQIIPVEEVELHTPLVLLGLSTRALNALDRVGANTVEGLLRTPLPHISHMRGVGSKTRREIAGFLKELAERFPNVEQDSTEPTEIEVGTEADVGLLSVDALVKQLFPSRIPKNAKPSQEVIKTFLRSSGTQGELSTEWPSQSDVAQEIGVTRARISQVLTKSRKRWLKVPALTALREEIAAILDAQGGVMTAAELAEAILARRGSTQVGPARARQAHAVTRAAIETERDRANPRWIVRRPHGGHSILIARDELDEEGNPLIDGIGLADYAERLGTKADELARADPLLSPDRAQDSLARVPQPTTVSPVSATRMRQLAVAASQHAALSSRLEVYPKDISAERSLRLALGALSGARELSPEQISERVRGRYPDAEALPTRPQLDELLREVGSQLVWRPEAANGQGAFVAPYREFTTVQSGTSYARTSTGAPRFTEVPAEEAEAKQFQQRLQYSVDQQNFLALVVSPRRALDAERILSRRFVLDVRSFDELLIRHMRQFAAERKVDWGLALRADAVPPAERSGSRDWNNLQRMVREALPRVESELAESPNHLLLTNLGLLARYEQLAFLDQLRDATGRSGGLPGLWLLVPTDAQEEKPTLDGRPVPVFTRAQWARIPNPWLLGGSEKPKIEEASA